MFATKFYTAANAADYISTFIGIFVFGLSELNPIESTFGLVGLMGLKALLCGVVLALLYWLTHEGYSRSQVSWVAVLGCSPVVLAVVNNCLLMFAG